MITFIAFFAIAVLSASSEARELEGAFLQAGVAGFSSCVRGLEQKRGSDPTAKALVELAARQDVREVQALATHTLGRMGNAGRAVLPELVKAVNSSGFPHGLVNELGPGDIPLWLAEILLRSDDPSFEEAAYALARQFDLKREERLLPLLLKAAARRDADGWYWAQYWAVRALGRMRETAAPAQPVLVDILKKEPSRDGEPSDGITWNRVRGAAARALGQIGAEPDGTAGLLTEMLNHRDRELRDWCALALADLDRRKSPERAARTLARLLTGHEREVEAAAAHVLGHMGKAGRAYLPELAKRINAGEFLLDLSHESDVGDVPLWLAEALLHAEGGSLDEVGASLAWCLDLSSETRLLPLLIQGASHANPDVRMWAIRAFGSMGRTAALARPVLVAILNREPPAHSTTDAVIRWNEVRGDAAFALVKIGTEERSTICLLTRMLKHQDEAIWADSAGALGGMGEKAAAAVPALLEVLARDEREPGLRPVHPAVLALGNIGEPAVGALIAAIQSRQVAVRRRAAEALARMRRETTKRALGSLIKAAAEDDDNEVRIAARLALRLPPNWYSNDSALLATLMRSVKDENPRVRVEAARLLRDMAWPAGVLPQPLVDLLADPDPSVRGAAVETLSSRRSDKNLMPALEHLVDHPDESVRATVKGMLKGFREPE